MIDDGRFPHGWSDKYAIKDMQRDAFVVGMRAATHSQHRSYNVNTKAAMSRPVHSNAATGTSPNMNDTRPDYNRDADGKPCHPWNWGNNCGFPSNHGENVDKKQQMCAWCTNKYHYMTFHREKDCHNKRRFTEKKSHRGSSMIQRPYQGF